MQLAILSDLSYFCSLFCIFIYLFIYLHTADIPLRCRSLEQQRKLQAYRREHWVRHTRDQVANLLEHILLQDLPWYEDRSADQFRCYK